MLRHAAALGLAVGLGACAGGTSTGNPVVGPAAPAGPGAQQSASAAAAGSVLNGVFSASQAARGEDVFRSVCSQCHGQNEFSGARFRVRWQGQTVGDIYEFVSTMMPDGDPGSLQDHEYADVVAYLLSLNRYPTGGADLPADRAALGAIRVEPASN